MAETPGRLAGALADRYRIEREIGAGRMATVYQGARWSPRRTGTSFSHGDERALFPQTSRRRDVAPGDRFLYVADVANQGRDTDLVMVEHWVTELRATLRSRRK